MLPRAGWAYDELPAAVVRGGAETAVSLRNTLPMEPSIGIFFARNPERDPAHD
jgi:hypothetical protein